MATCEKKYAHPPVTMGYGLQRLVVCDLPAGHDGWHAMTLSEDEATRTGIAVLYFEQTA